jgi:hypothetical protein
MKAPTAIIGVIETPTIDIGPRLWGNSTLGSLTILKGCTSRYECSFVEMDVDELYSIRVLQYYNLKIIIP